MTNDNADLIGRTFREHGVTRYRVTACDSEFPSIVHWENILTGETGCSLAVFIRPHLDPIAAPEGTPDGQEKRAN